VLIRLSVQVDAQHRQRGGLESHQPRSYPIWRDCDVHLPRSRHIYAGRIRFHNGSVLFAFMGGLEFGSDNRQTGDGRCGIAKASGDAPAEPLLAGG
jgi:hypothetical protein